MKDLDKFEMCLQAEEYEAAQVTLLLFFIIFKPRVE